MLVVPGRPSPSALNAWVLSEGGEQPACTLQGPGGEERLLEPLRLADSPASARDAWLVVATDLEPDASYRLTATHPGGDSATAPSWTLPERLTVERPFTIALGSCYDLSQDDGLEAVYPPPAHRPSGQDPIRLRFACGDQLYMDLDRRSGWPLFAQAPDPWERYPAQWRDPRFARFLAASPTLVTPDDHEYWNGVPEPQPHLHWTRGEEAEALRAELDRAYATYQLPLNVDPADGPPTPEGLPAVLDASRSFSFDVPPLSFFVLDVRSSRTRLGPGARAVRSVSAATSCGLRWRANDCASCPTADCATSCAMLGATAPWRSCSNRAS